MLVHLYVNEKGSLATSYSDDKHKYGQHTRNMVNVPEILSPYQKYSKHTRNMVKIPEVWSIYQKYGLHTRNMDNIPEIWSKYQKYGQHTKYGQQTRTMVNRP